MRGERLRGGDPQHRARGDGPRDAGTHHQAARADGPAGAGSSDRRFEGFEGAPFKEISINSDSLSFPIDLPVSLGLTAVFLSQSDLRG